MARKAEINDQELRDLALSDPSKGLGKKGQERAKKGKLTLAEVSRALNKHRVVIVRLVARGELSRDKSGLFSEAEVAKFAQRIARGEVKPAQRKPRAPKVEPLDEDEDEDTEDEEPDETPEPEETPEPRGPGILGENFKNRAFSSESGTSSGPVYGYSQKQQNFETDSRAQPQNFGTPVNNVFRFRPPDQRPGRMTLAEVARVLHKHRDIVIRMVAAQRLSRDDEGYFDAEEVQEIAEEMAVQRSDPAIDYLKRGYELELEHKARGMGMMFDQIQNSFKQLNDTVRMLSEANRVITTQNFRLTQERQQNIERNAETEIALKEQERAATMQGEFFELAKDALGKVVGGQQEKAVIGQFKKTALSLFQQLGEDGMQLIASKVDQETLGQLQKIMSFVDEPEAAAQ